jgi:hypothetical protein
MKFDGMSILAFLAVLLGFGLEAICIIGLIKEGLMLGSTRAIIGWSVGIVVFIPVVGCLIKLFLSTLDDSDD